VERAFSYINIIKIESWNKTGDEWFNHRVVCYIEKDIFTSIEDAKILDYFQGMRTRRNLPRTSGMYQLLILLNLFNVTFQVVFLIWFPSNFWSKKHWCWCWHYTFERSYIIACMSSLTFMTTLFRRTIFLYMLLLEFMVASARVLANFWVRHCFEWMFSSELIGS
jgi:hypothetical protein